MEEWSNEPLEGYERWDDYPAYPVYDWRQEVAQDATRFGYWAWVRDNLYWDSLTDATVGYHRRSPEHNR